MKRLIIFILVFASFLAFIVFNLENKSNISLGFIIFNDIPVFLIALFAFVFGLLVAIPMLFSLGKARKKPPKPSKKDEPSSLLEEINKEKSSYGID